MKKLILKKKFDKDMIMVTGTHCSGKSMICPVIASLKNVEPLKKIYFIDQINNLLYLKKNSSSNCNLFSKSDLRFQFLRSTYR